MTFITQNANIALLFLIVFASAGLVAATLYFQANFSKINEAYDLRIEELSHVTQELEAQKKSLAEVSSEAQIKAKREEEIAGRFGEVKSAKETLEQQKTSLESQVSDLKSSNNKLGAEVGSLSGELKKCQDWSDSCSKDLKEARYYRSLYQDACLKTPECKSKTGG